MSYILNCMMLHVSSISIKQKQKLSDLRCSRNLLGKIKKNSRKNRSRHEIRRKGLYDIYDYYVQVSISKNVYNEWRGKECLRELSKL